VIRAVLFDLDGTLYEDGVVLPGAADAVADLRHRGIEVGFVTNTTSRSRRLLSERLHRMKIEAPVARIATALLAGAKHLVAHGYKRVAPLMPDLALEDLAGFEIVTERPEAVVVGDLDDRWTFDILNTAFNQLMEGAELVALSADRYWRKEEVLQLDCGPFVKALEYASGKSAAVCGKPSAEFYGTALGSLGSWAVESPGDVLMVGDDIWGDIRGAQEAGLKACLVRTGKFRADVLEASDVRPDHIIEDVRGIASAL
jgi:phospholysine phosphohistidine inorganic pyrophosphate phosphatase